MEQPSFRRAVEADLPLILDFIRELAEYEHNGWAARDGHRWRLTPIGFLLSNQLIGELLERQESATLETTLPKVRQTPPPPPDAAEP